MYFAYFDESGDTGFARSPTNTFALAALLVNDKDWLSALDQTIAFRRYVRDNFRISTRAELKASWLVHGKGDFREAGLSYEARLALYRAAMRFQRKARIFRTFTVIIVKDRLTKQPSDVRDIAWQYAIERLERFGTSMKDNIHIAGRRSRGLYPKENTRYAQISLRTLGLWRSNTP